MPECPKGIWIVFLCNRMDYKRLGGIILASDSGILEQSTQSHLENLNTQHMHTINNIICSYIHYTYSAMPNFHFQTIQFVRADISVRVGMEYARRRAKKKNLVLIEMCFHIGLILENYHMQAIQLLGWVCCVCVWTFSHKARTFIMQYTIYVYDDGNKQRVIDQFCAHVVASILTPNRNVSLQFNAFVLYRLRAKWPIFDTHTMHIVWYLRRWRWTVNNNKKKVPASDSKLNKEYRNCMYDYLHNVLAPTRENRIIRKGDSIWMRICRTNIDVGGVPAASDSESDSFFGMTASWQIDGLCKSNGVCTVCVIGDNDIDTRQFWRYTIN